MGPGNGSSVGRSGGLPAGSTCSHAEGGCSSSVNPANIIFGLVIKLLIPTIEPLSELSCFASGNEGNKMREDL